MRSNWYRNMARSVSRQVHFDILSKHQLTCKSLLPLDLIIGSPPRAKKKEEEAQHATDCLDFVKRVGRLNVQHHRFDGLFYLLEISSEAKDHLPLEGLSRCVLQKTMYVCNWPLFLQKASLLSSKDPSGLPNKYVLESGTALSSLPLFLPNTNSMLF